MHDLTQSMIKKASQALQFAYAPYSNYLVSCCIQSEDGSLFTGVNFENHSYSLTTCAETSAIAQLISKGQKHIKRVVILSKDNQLCPPCGACRQRIFEFSTPDTEIHLCDQNSVLKTMTIDELLPLAFSLK